MFNPLNVSDFFFLSLKLVTRGFHCRLFSDLTSLPGIAAEPAQQRYRGARGKEEKQFGNCRWLVHDLDPGEYLPFPGKKRHE